MRTIFGFSCMAKFELFGYNISSSMKFLFLKSTPSVKK